MQRAILARVFGARYLATDSAAFPKAVDQGLLDLRGELGGLALVDRGAEDGLEDVGELADAKLARLVLVG